MRVQVCDSYTAIPAADWERLAASRSVFQDLVWYQRTPAYGRLRLLVAYREGRPVGLLPLFIMDRPGHYYHTPRDLFCGFRERALLETNGDPVTSLERAAAAEWFPAAVSVSPYGYRGGLIVEGEGDDAVQVAQAVAQAADDLCRREGVRIAAYFYLNERDDGAWLAALAGQGARTAIVGADCNLTVQWESLAAYFRALGPRGRRLRAEHRRAYRSRGVRWRALACCDEGPDAGLAQAVATLWAYTARRHRDPNPPLSLYQKALRSWPGRRLLLAGEMVGGDLRSALLVFAKGETLYPKFFGADDARGDYFFLTYSWLLDLAIAAGVSRIEYGGGSHQAKLLRGARLRWLLAGVQVYDQTLAARLACLLPRYEAAKVAYFSALAARYQVDHTPPSRPVIRGGDVGPAQVALDHHPGRGPLIRRVRPRVVLADV